VDSALAPRTDGGRPHERPGLGTVTPTPTSLTLGHPALEGGEVNSPTVGEQPRIEAQGRRASYVLPGEDRLKARRGASKPFEALTLLSGSELTSQA
jgi:hypothetical protein